MALSDNNAKYLKLAVAGQTVVPSIVYSNLSKLGLATKVEGAPSQGRGKVTIVATEAGRRAVA